MQASPLTRILDKLEIEPGSNLYVHSSFRFTKLLEMSGEQIIEELIQRIGPRGNLAMPSYWWHWRADARLWATYEQLCSTEPKPAFDIRHHGCNIGYLPQLFSQWPGVRRSLAYVFTISGYGPLAPDLTRNTASAPDDFDPDGDSTLGRMHQSDFRVLGLGLTSNTTSFGAVPDWVLGAEHTQEVFTREPVAVRMIDEAGREHRASSRWILPEVVPLTRPSEVIAQSAQLAGAYRETRLGDSIFFSYPLRAYVAHAVRLGREALSAGRGVPWLPGVPLRGGLCSGH